MYKEGILMLGIAETPIHAGSGSTMELIDLPIQREKHTNFPKIEASTLKGCLRDYFENNPKEKNDNGVIENIFGPKNLSDNAFAGAMSITDARLLFFPVKSIKGVFAYITCPYVLKRFKEDLQTLVNFIGKNNNEAVEGIKELLSSVESLEKVIKNYPDEKACSSSNAVVLVRGNMVVLEEFAFEVEKDNDNIGRFEEAVYKILSGKDNNDKSDDIGQLERRLVIVNDDVFKHFVEFSTEVNARIQIDDNTGTVKERALWYEEYMPAESIVYALIFFSDSRSNHSDGGTKRAEDLKEKFLEAFENRCCGIVQIGGNQTLGKGFLKVAFATNNLK